MVPLVIYGRDRGDIERWFVCHCINGSTVQFESAEAAAKFAGAHEQQRKLTPNDQIAVMQAAYCAVESDLSMALSHGKFPIVKNSTRSARSELVI
jgi:hypothetical protein